MMLAGYKKPLLLWAPHVRRQAPNFFATEVIYQNVNPDVSLSQEFIMQASWACWPSNQPVFLPDFLRQGQSYLNAAVSCTIWSLYHFPPVDDFTNNDVESTGKITISACGHQSSLIVFKEWASVILHFGSKEFFKNWLESYACISRKVSFLESTKSSSPLLTDPTTSNPHCLKRV